MLFLCSGLVDWLEKRQAPCFYKSALGVDCPGCGMQRAFIALLRGDFVESLKLYPALIPTIVMLVFLAVHIFYHVKNGARILVSLFLLNVVIIVISYICKLIV
ncbi:MAG: DUF2752 domain-containing protein [Bacteroidales bacterium]|jgi:hypothetical protein|nr:DUF2752 domain-containing protein [Bacteroidales bacterium]